VPDLEMLHDICGDDAAFRDELLSRFGESRALLLPRMDAAARAGDAALLSETAHQLKERRAHDRRSRAGGGAAVRRAPRRRR
jgi:hypothetical protein